MSEKVGELIPDVVYNIAQARIQANDFGEDPELLDRFQWLLENPPKFESGRFYLGLLFESTEEFLCDICLHLGQFFLKRDDIEEAKNYFETALGKYPGNVTAHQRLADIAIRSKSYIEAIKHLTRILEVSPLEEDKVYAHNNLGIACYENGMLDDAIHHLTTVLKYSPANPTAIHNLSFIYEREGIFEKSDSTVRAIRFVDVDEGASPIFELRGDEDSEDGGLAIIGKSAGMFRVMRHARVASTSDSPVLVHGESGSGKELLAQLITLNSPRCDAPFTVVNCASIPEMILESELFGHEKGAFTGARARKMGALEIANGGTVFLDELTALSPRLQGRLLRAIREKTFTPMGSMAPVPVNVRFISATTMDIPGLVEDGSFRADLYYELNIIPIDVPPLRERKEDVPLLVDYFLRKYSRRQEGKSLTFQKDDLEILMEYDWPGNVRELENLIQRAIVMGSQSNLYLEELARLRRSRAASSRRESQSDDSIRYPITLSLSELEQRHIRSVLENCDNNQSQAAKILGINPSTLWRKLKNYGKKKEKK